MDQNNCRICLEISAILNWNVEIFDLCGLTYKDCYYKYTQLEELVTDPFPQMLCEKCAADLKDTHFLIQNALESHKILQKTFVMRPEISKQENCKEFETVFIEKLEEAESTIESDNDSKTTLKIRMVDQSETGKICKITEEKVSKKEKVHKKLKDSKVKNEILDLDNNSLIQLTLVQQPTDLETKDNKVTKNSKKVHKKLKEVKKEKLDVDIPKSLSDKNSSSEEISKKKRKYSYIMCALCSKLIHCEYIKAHEDTHKEHRERNEICPKCGIKLYHKRAMYNHMLIHQENREKKYKCEFCDKAYFHRGGLNIHRRIHLGQMVSCPICSKEFYRQVDLDSHVATHSAAPLNTNLKKQQYYVECKECGKNVPSRRWKTHQDAHLNIFKMKCTLCDKHFVTRHSCQQHVRRAHKTTKSDYDKVILYYGDTQGRTSHLMIQQTQKLKPILE